MTTVADLTDNERKALANGLGRVLAETYTLKIITHGYHWNVTGPHFSALHALFEVQYTELEEAIDDIAERIRAIGIEAPGSITAFQQLNMLPEAIAQARSADEMLQHLAQGNEHLARTASAARTQAETVGDQATLDLMVERIAHHEKAAWMLRAHLTT